MKKFLKILGMLAGVAAAIILVFLIYFNLTFPKAMPVPSVKVEITPERIARGEYLANHVSLCMGCHSRREFNKYAGPIDPASMGQGGEEFDGPKEGVPGTVYALNITPANIGSWTDGELIRAITTGITKDGKALFTLMPYDGFNKLSKEDLYSIVAYIRTLKPIESKIPDRKLNFPMNFIVKTMPMPSYIPSPVPNKSDTAAYGKYLFTISVCSHCHTPMDKGKPIGGLTLAGGMEFHLPWGTVRTANITPDSETGIGKWSKEYFISRFKQFDSDSTRNIPVKKDEFNTVMPWTLLAGMKEEDLGAIYAYLRTVKPVKHSVVIFTKN